MLVTLISLPLVSWIMKTIFERGILSEKFDILKVFSDDSELVIAKPPAIPKQGFENPNLDFKEENKKPIEGTKKEKKNLDLFPKSEKRTPTSYYGEMTNF